jgi:sugar lactone lactonase YvrE
MPNPRRAAAALALGLILAGAALAASEKPDPTKKPVEDPYAKYVWPPPPDVARIKLDAVVTGRADVEAMSKYKKKLMRDAPLSPYDFLRKPFAVAIDGQGRILVTDEESIALIRFDRNGRRMDVFGTKGDLKLRLPLGIDVSKAGVIYVADAGLRKVLAFDGDGAFVKAYGQQGALANPSDVAVSPEGTKLYVADSKAHKVVVFDVTTGALVSSFGAPGEKDGQFAAPTSLAFGPDGRLFVVDQLNCRVQVFDPDGTFADQFGGRGTGYGQFVRPKDVAVDAQGRVYVTDSAFGNVQIFDADFRLLTFVGSNGTEPGQFFGVSGVAVRGDSLAAVDQLGKRLQVFRLLPAVAGH